MAKKPSTQIVDLIETRLTADGGASLSAADVARIKALTTVIDRRDQQRRKGKTKTARRR